VKRTHGRVVHVSDLADLDRRLAAGASDLGTWRVHGLDLTDRGAARTTRRVAGAAFLGCAFAPGDDDALAAAGALVLPAVGDAPLDVYRSRLYTPDELYDAGAYRDTLDARAYAWAQEPPDREDALAIALHDHAIDEAITAWTPHHRIAGVMGGHGLQRDDPGYADAARLGRGLAAAGLTVATGGGPGAMEAANLGARLPDDALEAALATVAAVPSFRPSVDAWVRTAREAMDGVPVAAQTLGVPTWHYGHEPPNLFATAIAKYLRNATREAVLVEICDAGIVFLPGAAGTVQEVFQDGCENYYADSMSLAPMVLLGERFWTETLPVHPLLEALAADRPMADHVHLVDTVEDAVAVLAAAGSAGASGR
jgi:predicted Rossmann-fold nucleotide-binding protein